MKLIHSELTFGELPLNFFSDFLPFLLMLELLNSNQITRFEKVDVQNRTTGHNKRTVW